MSELPCTSSLGESVGQTDVVHFKVLMAIGTGGIDHIPYRLFTRLG